MDTIQPQGVLFVCEHDGLAVLRVSANLRDWLGVFPKDLIGRPLRQLLDVGDAAELAPADGRAQLRMRTDDGRVFDALTHRAGDAVIVELERASEALDDRRPLERSLRASILALHGVFDSDRLHEAAAAEVRQLTGFDRVTIARHSADGSSTVVAESVRGGLASLRGTRHAPELLSTSGSDRAAQLVKARVADVTYSPVRLVPALDSSPAPPADLRHALLAGVAQPELDALKNVGARASLSISLRAGGALLGTIACHHYGGPRTVPFALVEGLEHLARTLSWQLHALERAERVERRFSGWAGSEHDLDPIDPIKDEFIATLSHELRNPLNVVAGWTTLLKSGNLSAAERVRAIEVIDRNVGLQRRLVDDLLDASKAARGQLTLDLVTSDLNELVEDVVNACGPALEAKSLSIERALVREPVSVRADLDRLRQVVSNLMTNAIKFTPSGGRIRVATRIHDGYSELEVADTGPGIAPSFLPHVFEPFRQGARTGKAGAGLGLGLTIARQLVELHGGSITAQSSGLGLGSTFYVRLPLAIP